VHVLLDAVRKIAVSYPGIISRTSILIAGCPASKADEQYYQDLKNFVRQNDLSANVEFLGYLSDEDTAKFFNDIDVLVLPYAKTGSASASGPLMWARSVGLPVVASNTTNFKNEISHGQDGLIYDDELVGNQLHDELLHFLGNRPLRETIIGGCAGRMKQFSWANSSSKFVQILKDI
jgi:glycosyltransferase involved in cell wall biosynthesis